MRKLNEIPGISLPATSVRKRPSFDLALVAGPEAMAQLLEVLDWVLGLVRQAYNNRKLA